jgi:integrase
MVKNKKTFPSLKDLELVKGKIKSIKNRKGEFKRQIHYGCYLLCSQAGLRISEAVRFDLTAKNKQGLYRITKPKKQKERLVYVSKEVIRELKSQN